jgi:two-component system, NarL family, sensor histidine kinase DesK
MTHCHADTLLCVESNPSPDLAARSTPVPRSAVAVRGTGVAATWLVTAGVVLFFEVVILGLWVPVVAPATGGTSWSGWACLSAGSVWVASSAWLLWIYRSRPQEGSRGAIGSLRSRRTIPVVACAGASVLLVVASGMLLVGGAVIAQTIVLLRESVGARRRLCLAVTAAVAALWLIDVSLGLRPVPPPAGIGAASVYALLLPSTSAFALWWWDIVEQLDHARAAEGRLAAIQERLRLANDVHDLQGHHLQVIALQLELAERLLTRDPTAALEQVRAARSSVDDARQGTRDLARRFRGVPLADELANAADLLRAAGIRVELSVAHQAAQAPTDVLGPVIRETTTNMLKHSGGGWATLTLRRSAHNWTYTARNDVAGRRPGQVRAGNGLRGIDERVRAVGGHVAISGELSHFEVSATVPGTDSRTDDDRGGDR